MKRPRDVFDTPASSSPPHPSTKRRYLSAEMDSSPSSSQATTPYIIPKSTFFSRPSPWASITPHDSPSNPFGLNRSLQALTLPRPSGFAKHIVLRMQVVSSIETRSRSRRTAAEAPYRVVQVPLNYSFRLLHMLILFLFASDARLRVRRQTRVFSPTSIFPRQPPPPPRKSKSQLEVFGESPRKDEGHVFDVFEGISVYSGSYRPGVIIPGSGKLYTKLSSTRDRKLFPDGYEGGDEDDVDIFGCVPKKNSGKARPSQEYADDDGWDWEAEDDYVVGNVWTEGPDLSKGIIYVRRCLHFPVPHPIDRFMICSTILHPPQFI